MDTTILDKIVEIIISKEFYIPVITIIITIILVKISKNVVAKFIKKDSKTLESKRRNTVIALVENIVKYIIIIFAVLVILSSWGVNVTSIIAGLGIAGVVAGLALQDALKDIIMGCNIIMDNYFVVGDLVTFNGFTGEVIEFGLKNTKIKNADGVVLVVANREIAQIMNLSQKSANIVLKILVAYEEKEEKVAKILKGICQDIKDWEYVLEDPQYLGIDAFQDSAVIYMLSAKCVAGNQFAYKRQILSLIKKEFDKNKIKIPYPQIEVHNGKGF